MPPLNCSSRSVVASPPLVTVITVDDDAHGCYVGHRFVGSCPFLGSDAEAAFAAMAKWLGWAVALIQHTPERFAELGGDWPEHLDDWGDNADLRGHRH